ncbi:hypothetical protein JRQ81_018929, partial [Phrynocephalus forsythii]
MLKPYHRIESWALCAVKEDSEEQDEILCWEGREEPQFNPEKVELAPTLTQSQRKE